jgi:pyruvate dehydrogenase E1 component
MYEEQESVFYYLTVENENYPMAPMPEGAKEGILKGMYKFKPSEKKGKLHAQLLGSGAILNEAVKAQEILEKDFNVAADVWSVTSYKELRREAMEAERWNLLNPGKKARVPYVTQCLKDAPGVVVAASDYIKLLADGIGRWVPQTLLTLGTDGFGRSESREALRDFFEVDARFIALAALTGLARDGKVKSDTLKKAFKKLEIDPGKANPVVS